MNRRLPASIAALVLATTVASASDPTVLLEAESFADAGGWQIDSQFVEQMGSPVLIAHGLGQPVAGAQTTVTFPGTGDYRVWVRTRNWVPSHPEAPPGRFQVAVNGTDLATVFGTGPGTWHWQDGGTVTIPAESAVVALKDLAGFDGRCDAIAFIQGTNPPPPAEPALAAWRKALRNETETPEDVRTFDCVVVGGGQAGCAAALAAARSGIRVGLVQDRPVLGGNASAEIRVCPQGEVRHPIVAEITRTGSNRDDSTVAADAVRLARIQAETNITLFMPWRAYGAGTNAAGRVAYVDARHTRTGDRVRLQGAIFIDCTGDAWVGWWTGAEFRMGREARGEFNESRAPANADAMTMGNSLMWKTRDAGVPSAFPSVPWAVDVAGTRADTGGDWNWEYGMSLNTITDAEQIRDHLLRAIYGNFYNAKLKPANSNLALAWVPFVAGKRESRRLMGDHLLVQGDVENGVYFEDAIGTATWGIDIHAPTAISYLSTYTSTAVSKWYIPFRCLYSRNIPNLMMAGRCASVSHIGLGSPRVQNTTAQMGVAAGYAAAICRQYGIEPRDIYRNADRTVELQAKITGSWPARPTPGVVVADNAQTSPVVRVIGAWTTSSSTPGYYGANYLHDGNSGRGTKRVVFTPALALPGDYDVSMRWCADASRASNAPVWVFEAPQVARVTATDAVHIRSGQPDQGFASDEMIVGRYQPDDYTRGLMRFDLSPVPTGAVIVSVEFQLSVTDVDTNSAPGYVGAAGLTLHRVTEPFDAASVTWNQRAAGAAWTTNGGTFTPTALSTLATPTDPNLVSLGQLFPFPITDALTAAATDARQNAATLELLVRTPSLETSYNARKIYRFGTSLQVAEALRPALLVKYFVPQLPPAYTVNQRVNGGQWVRLGSHHLAGGEVSVILGNDNANGYVIADAVRIANTNNVTAGDLDGDGLPDWWERFHFLSETAAGAADDPDGDGMSNFVECMTSTDPNDRRSRFDMHGTLDATPGEFLLTWPSASNRTYRIEVAEELDFFLPFVEHLPATPPQNSYRVPAGDERQYYRVVLEP